MGVGVGKAAGCCGVVLGVGVGVAGFFSAMITEGVGRGVTWALKVGVAIGVGNIRRKMLGADTAVGVGLTFCVGSAVGVAKLSVW